MLTELDATGFTRTIDGASLRLIKGGLEDWHKEFGDGLAQHYSIQGFTSTQLLRDWALLRKTCGNKHPSEMTYLDFGKVIEAYSKADAANSTKEWFVARMKSIYGSLRLLGLIDQSCEPDKGLKVKSEPKKPPRPLSYAQAELLMTKSDEPYREWFMFGCLAGLRAMEIANIEGRWLEKGEPGPDGEVIWLLRVFGKGATEKIIACHPALVELILSKKTQGRLYAIQPHYLSKMVNAEMRRMGIVTKNHNQKSNTSRLSFHSTRHYFATALLRKSNDIFLVSKAMRHADPRTTMIYAELDPVRQAEMVGLLFADTDFMAQ